MPYNRLMRYKAAIKDNLANGKTAYICPICDTSLYIVQSVKKQAFFRHQSESNDCPIKTRGKHSREEIRRIVYAFRTESKAHKKLKAQVLTSTSVDNSFSKTISETVLKGANISDGWRRPDVKSVYNSIPIVFEAQVNSTFLDVVLARRRFYKDQKICLLWIMPSFNPYTRRVLHDDIINQHRGAAFVVDDETVSLSKKQNKFILYAWQYSRKKSDWIKKTVSFEN